MQYQLLSRFFFSEGLIRVAFQSLQLVVTDFLPLMPCTCIKVVVDVAGKFGLQPQELNISLTAIGLLVSHVIHFTPRYLNSWKRSRF